MRGGRRWETQLRAWLPVNLHGLVRGYLRDREVVVKYAGGRKGTSKGCIQGSIAGPTFWNLILDSLLRELGELGVYVQAFADDVVLMFSGQSASSIEEANRALARVHCWEQKLTFIPHVAKACKRLLILQGLSPSSQGDVGSESGDREDHIHYRDRAYRSVRFVRLGTGDEEARRAKMLDAVQRSVALKACRAHRTVSLHSALILARLLPLDIRVGKWPGYTRLSAERFRGHFCRPGARDPCISAICLTRARARDRVRGVGPRPQTVDRLVVGPRIFTDGGDGRAAKSDTEVKNGRTGWSTFSVTPGPPWRYWPAKTYHPLAHEARRDISEIVAEGRAVRLFWVRAHAGIAGNERADELARRAALTKKTAADYDRFPLSYAKSD
ncbi:Retrovirus-related Pol polyprotein from type-1 retrotransposable element R1 [Eumeta japonica]|uniref:Retrovirus-related Pol polyprotein from type-1 retrotransposable element R1 n=1 Tax=Eumeta variegata TaxID=151549 RepID=A0A4C1SU24_EUMVA|nr:Retrovirus-related Pol polyprotein from type-1 retrotransposable element R1 [Eumeta japonica]